MLSHVPYLSNTIQISLSEPSMPRQYSPVASYFSGTQEGALDWLRTRGSTCWRTDLWLILCVPWSFLPISQNLRAVLDHQQQSEWLNLSHLDAGISFGPIVTMATSHDGNSVSLLSKLASSCQKTGTCLMNGLTRLPVLFYSSNQGVPWCHSR